MEPLATLDDVTARYPGTLTQDQQGRAAALLTDASTVVRSFTRQQFTAGASTERIRPIGERLYLRQSPVVSVDAVAVVDVLATSGLLTLPLGAWMWDGGQEIWIGALNVVINLPDDIAELLEYEVPLVQVTYTHGYDTIPDPVISVVCSVVVRALDIPGPTGIVSQTVGGLSYRLSPAAQDGVLGLTDAERCLLAPYRRPASTVELR
ncbi:MAG TPA: hypothetical protein VFW65_32075 [Pseudonocardiaceae bacterium]|nr:hypothetical protein [Pseudonocardiaceae bacterium]